MATKNESKTEHIEELLRANLGDEALSVIQVLQQTISTETPSRTAQRNLTFSTPNRCFESRVIDVSGSWRTQPNGQVVFKLFDFLCPSGEVLSSSINVLATPNSSKPFYLTVNHKLVNNNTDVEITVFSWAANGAPAPSVTFNWRCRVEHPHVIV